MQIALLLLKIQGQTDQIIESLTTIATKDYDNQVRRQAVEAMRLLPRPNRRVIDALIEELNIATPDTSTLRLEAASSLFEAAKAIDALIAASLNELSKKLKSLNKIPIIYSKRKQEVYIKRYPNSEVLKKY